MKVHTVLTPVAPVLDEVKLLPKQRVKWMRDLKALWRTDTMRCS